MTFNEGDKVIIVGGTYAVCEPLIIGHIFKTNPTMPGTEHVSYAAPWGGGVAYNIPLDHLSLVNAQGE